MSYHINCFNHILEIVLSHLVKSKSKAKWRAKGGGRSYVPDAKRSACFFVGSQIKLAAKSQCRPHSQMVVLFSTFLMCGNLLLQLKRGMYLPTDEDLSYVYHDPLGKFCFVDFVHSDSKPLKGN